MAHARQAIIDDVVTTVTGLTTTGTRVTKGAVYAESALPALRVYANEEESLEDSMALGTKETRALMLTIEGVTEKVSDVDAQLDTIDAEVQTAIYADQTLGATCKTVRWVGMVKEFSDEGDKPRARITMTYTAIYRVDGTDPTALIS